MAEIRPFKALRFNTEKAGDISQLVCPPYDIISDEQRAQYLASNPCNIIRLELPKGDRPYEDAGNTLSSWLSQGILRTDDKPSIYIYEEEFTVNNVTRSFKGCIVRVKIEEFSKGVILPHENTLSKAKEDRFNLMKATNCNFSQIYSLFMDDKHEITERLDKLSAFTPLNELTDPDNVTHRLWAVTDEEEIAAICKAFEDKKLYIADGHHRYETALNYRNYCRENGIGDEARDYVMMMLVDMEHPGLLVLPTHRLVRDLSSFDKDELLNGCREYFDITEENDVSLAESRLRELYDRGEKAFAFYCGGSTYNLMVLRDMNVCAELMPDSSRALRELDVSILHTLVLEKVFGIDAENMAKQINLTYVKQFEDAVAAVQDGKAQCAFILNPTRVTEIRDVAAAGEKMPQKSTYFYPKLITGLVMNKF